MCSGALVFAGCGTSEQPASGPEEQASTPGSPASAPTSQPQPRALPTRQRSRAPRQPSGPAAPALGRPTKSTACQVRGQLPDPACTPGAIFAGATVSQVCTPGYSSSVRNVPESLKLSVYAEYGIESHVSGSYEVDHLVSLELGGSNSIANLWPEVSPGFHQKDEIENRLHDAVCAGRVSLRAAQLQIARDWRHTFAGPPSGSGTATPSAPTRANSAPGPVRLPPGTPAEFCTTHRCIASFDEGHGTIVQCADGEWSHSGGRPGVCSRHGGPR
jgi:hypothetical protein